MDKIIYMTITLKCNIEKAFELFTRNEHLEKWLTMKSEVVPEVGGKYELFWNLEERENDSTIGCKILALDPPKLLCFEWKGPKQFKHFMNDVRPLTNVAIYILPKGEESEVHLLHTGWRDTQEWEKARQWFDTAWLNAFSRLHDYVLTL